MQIATHATSKLMIEESEHAAFELFGYDFMIDTDLNVWLIEVNQNPCLSTLSPKQGVLINNLISDVMK
jgi:tubulin monoglycylase TTLL3/8